MNSASELPENAAETPGGTMFAFTPGGTKIIYDRDFLLHLKHSPASKVKKDPVDSSFSYESVDFLKKYNILIKNRQLVVKTSCLK